MEHKDKLVYTNDHHLIDLGVSNIQVSEYPIFSIVVN